jgi:hypothetical protein
MNKNQYGFTPQTSTVDAAMALKDYVQSNIDDGQYVALISLDMKGVFDAAWWPGIMTSLRQLGCPGNLYKLCGSYFKDRTAFFNNEQLQGTKKHKQRLPTGFSI